MTTGTVNFTICVVGCDDETTIEYPMTEAEFALVNSIALKITEASTYGCMPRMTVTRPAPPQVKEHE